MGTSVASTDEPTPLCRDIEMDDRMHRLSRWPRELIEFEIALRFEGEAVFTSLSDQLRGFETVQVTERSITGIFSVASEDEDLHGHVNIRLARERVHFYMSFHKRRVDVPLSLDYGRLIAIAKGLESSRTTATVIASLRYSMEEWRSTVPLPITLPGMLDSANGSPEIAGFEFSFKDENWPVLRAEISIFDVLKEYRVRVMHIVPNVPWETLLDRGLSASNEHSSLLILNTSPRPTNA